MTLQEKVQLVKQRLGDAALASDKLPPPVPSTGKLATLMAVSTVGLVIYSIPTLLSLYFLYKINKNTKRAK